MKSPIPLSDLQLRGDLAVRAVLNYGRLEGHWYRPEEVFSADQSGWPGDWEGRILLALSLLAQSTGRPPAYLDEILSLVPQHLNAKGYFGPVLPPGVHDEQQLAGNSWFLRALIEIYRWRKDETLRPMIETLVRNLLLPAIGHYQDYPIDPATRDEVPSWNLSKIQHKAVKHKETLDTGCAFIMLDGASAAYQLLRWPELRPLLDEMIARYLEMDFKTLQVQTHATLTALRGILRLYETDGDPRHLQIVEQMFAFYKKEAWTEIHGNYNWFCRPRWTEPIRAIAACSRNCAMGSVAGIRSCRPGWIGCWRGHSTRVNTSSGPCCSSACISCSICAFPNTPQSRKPSLPPANCANRGRWV
jgi:hypothetical protein